MLVTQNITEYHRIVGVGRDLCGSSSPTPLPKQGHLQQAAQDLEVQLFSGRIFSSALPTQQNTRLRKFQPKKRI